MKSLNKVQLIGWLGKDPEFITKKDGGLMARLNLATDIFVRQKEGPPAKITTWHTVIIWKQKLIENIRSYLLKGSHVMVDGRISYSTFEDSFGHTRYMTEITANYLVDLDR